MATRDPYKYFRVEARELLEQLGQTVLGLERGEAASTLLPRLLRLVHTLKGAARVVKQTEIASLAHAIEDLLSPWREQAQGLPRECIDGVLERLDRIAAQVAVLTPAGDPGVAARPLPEEAPRTLRTDVAEMDGVLDGIAETHAQLAAARRRLAGLGHARSLAERLQEQLTPRGGRAPWPDNGARKVLPLVEELQGVIGASERGLVQSVDRMSRELRQAREAAEQMRLLPAGSLFAMLERSVRDAAQALGKRVLFEARGGDVRLDAPVVIAVQSALLQMVRNAVAHGVEAPAERQAAGKPPDGRVTVEALRRGRRAVFRCSDDGAGVDLEAVRRSAQRKGLLSSEAQALDAQALVRLLLRGGISTSPVVSEVSGRGIGLDVVREAAERLGGDVTVQTEPGNGTALELTVPVSLASLEALAVEASGMTAAIPLDAVRRTLRLAPAQIARAAQGDTVVFDEQVVPYLPLARVLNASAPASATRSTSAVVVEGGGALAVIGVDRLLGTSKIVLRPLPDLVPASPLVAGVSLDVEGNPQLVLDSEGLVHEAQRAGTAATQAEAARLPVLVIDDSLTTRMLEQSILESAGYEVHAAVSAEEALVRARRTPYALFLVDVEMPGMDGFAFVEHTRADPALRGVPAMLVTSRSSPEDRQRGHDVGARHYIVKSDFSQAEFLDRVRELVQAP